MIGNRLLNTTYVWHRRPAGVVTGETPVPQVLLWALGQTRRIAIISMACLTAGCASGTGWQSAQTGPAAKMPGPEPVSNIVSVNKFFSAVPWLIFDDPSSGRIDGFKCTVYLEGHDSPKGVFGTGTIVVSMYRLDNDPLGREVPTQVHEWELPPDKAYPWRAKKPTMIGWGYGLRLGWGKDLDLMGKRIAILIKYIRDDGRVISSSRTVLRVPVVGDAVTRVSRAASPSDHRI